LPEKEKKGKGGTTDNAILIDNWSYSCELRFRNEIARHKVLDLIGDLLK
jgi:UDP-3-O-acyl-N-acetylglucosamine deacetylase